MPGIKLSIPKLTVSAIINARSIIICAVLFLLSSIMSGCAINPATGRRQLMMVSEEQEFRIGQEVDKQVRDEIGIYIELAELRRKFKELVDNIARHSDRSDVIYRAEIVDTPDFNAFAVPGGFVYAHRGLLERMNSFDELASVMAHEIAHVATRHSASMISRAQLLNLGLMAGTIATGGELQSFGDVINISSVLAFSKFSRDDEREADYYGIKYMTNAGYNPLAAVTVMEQIQRLHDREPESLEIWFMTHPPTSERIGLIKNQINEMSNNDPGVLNRRILRNEYIALLDGMAVGEWNGSELVKDDRYYNKEYYLSLPVPRGWQVAINSNQYTAVFADTKNDSYAFFDIQTLRTKKDSEQYLRELSSMLEKQGLKRTADSHSTKKLAHGAISQKFSGSVRGIGDVNARLITFTRDGNGYSILGVGKQDSFESLDPQFIDMINRMEFLSPEVASKIEPPRMRVHKVSRGETWDSITKHYFKDVAEKQKLAEYNGLSHKEPLTSGTLLKIPPTMRFK